MKGGDSQGENKTHLNLPRELYLLSK